MKASGTRSVASVVIALLNVAVGMMVLGLVLVVVLFAIMPLVKEPVEVDASWLVVGSRMTIPVSFTIDTGAHPVVAPSLGVDRAQIQDATGSLQFPMRGGAFVIGNGVLLFALFAASLWVLRQLRAVVRTVRDGQPFVAANVRRIRWIAAAVIVGELIRTAIVYGENYYAMTYFTAPGLQFVAHPALNIPTLVSGLIILVTAEAFATGTRLDQDQSLTI